ncbi:MAG: Secretion system C-terminal sorting domain [Bacteroidetes bacterium]|jgi:hypothetical protein|nr:Secretion system C-terminal sorting domain [Bacteroidota bacterium]
MEKCTLIRLLVGILLLNFSGTSAQDYRDNFIGVFHTATPPCVSADQTPPNRYVQIQKDTQNTNGIYVTDSIWYQNVHEYRHPCMLDQSDSTYWDGAQSGKFISTDTLRVITPVCGSIVSYFLKKLNPTGTYTADKHLYKWYLFPNPAINEINIFLPGMEEKLKCQLIDAKGAEVINKEFTTKLQLDVSNLSGGMYTVKVTGNTINLNKRLVLME